MRARDRQFVPVATLLHTGLHAAHASTGCFCVQVSAYWKEYIDRLTFYVNEHAKTTEGRATQLLNDMLPKQVGPVAVYTYSHQLCS